MLQSNNITLEKCVKSHLPELHTILSNSQTRKYICVPYKENDCNCLLDYIFEEKQREAFVVKYMGEIVGYIAAHSFDFTHQFAQLTCFLSSSFQEKGIMSETYNLFLPYIFSIPNLQRVEAQVFVENFPIVSLLEKKSFVREGRLRKNFMIEGKLQDSYLYALLKEDIS